MICYHYTSLDNYQWIKRQGLVPYLIHRPHDVAFRKLWPDGIVGIWLWDHELKGDEHLGSLLWQLSTKRTSKIVRIKIAIDVEECFHENERLVRLLHSGIFGDFTYHKDCTALIHANRIAPSKFMEVRKYDLEHLTSKGKILGFALPSPY